MWCVPIQPHDGVGNAYAFGAGCHGLSGNRQDKAYASGYRRRLPSPLWQPIEIYSRQGSVGLRSTIGSTHIIVDGFESGGEDR